MSSNSRQVVQSVEYEIRQDEIRVLCGQGPEWALAYARQVDIYIENDARPGFGRTEPGVVVRFSRRVHIDA